MIQVFIERVKRDYSKLPNAQSALQALNCIAYIQKQLRGSNARGFLELTVKEGLMRDPDGTSFHVKHLTDTEAALNYFQRIIQHVEGAIDTIIKMQENPKNTFKINYIECFLQNFRDSDVGCMEARIKKALDFVAFLEMNNGVLKLENLMQEFLSKLPENIDQKNDVVIFHQALKFFSPLVALNYPIIEETAKRNLNWTSIKNYLSEIFSYDVSLFPHAHQIINAPHEQFEERKHGVRWILLYFKYEDDAKLYFAFIQSMLPDEFQYELNQARITKVRGGNYRFRLSLKQYLSFTRLLSGESESSLVSLQKVDPPPQEVDEDLYLIKMIRADEKNYLRSFCAMLTPSSVREEKITLRTGKKKKFTVNGHGVFNRKEKLPQYSQKEKEGFSHHNSTSLIRSDLRAPPFGFNKRLNKLVGFYFKIESCGVLNALLNRMFIYDGGTVGRPYDFDTAEEANKYYEEKVGEVLFSDLAKFIKRLLEVKNQESLNEVLARLRWNLDGSTGVCIASDTLEARLLAIEYARTMRNFLKAQYRELGLKFPVAYQVPIKFYCRDKQGPLFKDYSLDQQLVDKQEAISAFYKNNYGSSYEHLLAFDDSHVAFEFHKNYRDLDEFFSGRYLINDVLRLSYFHIAEFLIEKDNNFNRTKEIIGKWLLNDSFFENLILNNKILILDWLRRSGCKFSFNGFLRTKLREQQFNYEDLSMLAYILQYWTAEQYLGEGDVIFLEKALNRAIRDRHRTFIDSLKAFLKINRKVTRDHILELVYSNCFSFLGLFISSCSATDVTFLFFKKLKQKPLTEFTAADLNMLVYLFSYVNQLTFEEKDFGLLIDVLTKFPNFASIVKKSSWLAIWRYIQKDGSAQARHHLGRLSASVLSKKFGALLVMLNWLQTASEIPFSDLTLLQGIVERVQVQIQDDKEEIKSALRFAGFNFYSLLKIALQFLHFGLMDALFWKLPCLEKIFEFHFELGTDPFFLDAEIVKRIIVYAPQALKQSIPVGTEERIPFLSWLIYSDAFQSAALLIDEPSVEINAPSFPSGLAPLHFASRSTFLVARLLERADLAFNYSADKRTALHEALVWRNYAAAQLLLNDPRFLTQFNIKDYPGYENEIERIFEANKEFETARLSNSHAVILWGAKKSHEKPASTVDEVLAGQVAPSVIFKQSSL